MKLIINRLKEPSTWAGLGILASFLHVPPGVWELVQTAGVALAGLAAIATPEKTQ